MCRWGPVLSKEVGKEKEGDGRGGVSRATTSLGLRCYEVVTPLIHILILPSWEEPSLEESLIPVIVTGGCWGAHKGSPDKLAPSTVLSVGGKM